MENDLFKENTGDQNKNFGVMNLSIHYSLAAGLAEQLGDQVEGAVVAAVANIGAANGKFVFDGAAIRMDQFWHSRKNPALATSNPVKAVSIHLSSDLESELTFSVDWEWY
jgi:hypothetical protein